MAESFFSNDGINFLTHFHFCFDLIFVFLLTSHCAYEWYNGEMYSKQNYVTVFEIKINMLQRKQMTTKLYSSKWIIVVLVIDVWKLHSNSKVFEVLDGMNALDICYHRWNGASEVHKRSSAEQQLALRLLYPVSSWIY